MSVGKQYLHEIREALDEFEEAVTAREHPGLLGSKVPLRQKVDTARQRVVDLVVKIVTAERLKK